MEDLGDLCGLDYDTAYFMKHGKKAPEFKGEKINCFYDDFTKESLAYESMYEPALYECYRGWRMPAF